ncbi:MAG: hypothetical protein HQ534_13530 [Armatimonadetes bacterium]|nr:hypothetical protein [Armatimonadota bacterium]
MKKILFIVLIILFLFIYSYKSNDDYSVDVDDFPKIFNQIKTNYGKSGKIIINKTKLWDYIIICRPYMFGNKLSEETGLILDEAMQIEAEMETTDDYKILFVFNQHIYETKDIYIKNSSIISMYGYIFVTNEKNYFYYELIKNTLQLYGQDRVSQHMKRNPDAPAHEHVW